MKVKSAVKLGTSVNLLHGFKPNWRFTLRTETPFFPLTGNLGEEHPRGARRSQGQEPGRRLIGANKTHGALGFGQSELTLFNPSASREKVAVVFASSRAIRTMKMLS